MPVVDIETRLIAIRPDARKVNDAVVRSLADSIAEVGVINPIRVRPARRFVDGVQADAFEVTAGVHRLKAVRKLGLVSIPCIVVEDSDLRAELAMIDENLMRAELSPADRAANTARRKAIYEELYPETRHGGDRKSDQVDKLSTRSFADATAEATGRDARTVRRDAERGEKISEQALAMVRGSRLDKGDYLDKIKKLDAAEQVAKVERDLRAPVAARKPVKLADEPLTDFESQERQVAALMAAWNRASAEARAEFLSRIETPVFDRSAA